MHRRPYHAWNTYLLYYYVIFVAYDEGGILYIGGWKWICYRLTSWDSKTLVVEKKKERPSSGKDLQSWLFIDTIRILYTMVRQSLLTWSRRKVKRVKVTRILQINHRWDSVLGPSAGINISEFLVKSILSQTYMLPPIIYSCVQKTSGMDEVC
jgi:hypothetical protein